MNTLFYDRYVAYASRDVLTRVMGDALYFIYGYTNAIYKDTSLVDIIPVHRRRVEFINMLADRLFIELDWKQVNMLAATSIADIYSFFIVSDITQLQTSTPTISFLDIK